MVLRELSRLGPSIRPHGELLLLFDSEEADLGTRQRGFQLLHREGCLIPEFEKTTSKDTCSQCDQLQGIHIQVKSEHVGTLMTTELMTQSRTTSTTTCLMWPQT